MVKVRWKDLEIEGSVEEMAQLLQQLGLGPKEGLGNGEPTTETVHEAAVVEQETRVLTGRERVAEALRQRGYVQLSESYYYSPVEKRVVYISPKGRVSTAIAPSVFDDVVKMLIEAQGRWDTFRDQLQRKFRVSPTVISRIYTAARLLVLNGYIKIGPQFDWKAAELEVMRESFRR